MSAIFSWGIHIRNFKTVAFTVLKLCYVSKSVTNGLKDGWTDEQPRSNMPLQLLWSWGHKNLGTDFQDGGHNGFLIRNKLAMFDIQVILILPIKFRVYWPCLLRGSISKYIFMIEAVATQLWFPIWTILAIFLPQEAPILITKSVGLSVQEEKFKIDFQEGHHGGHLEFLIKTIFAYYLSTRCSDTSQQVSSHLVFPFRRRSSKYLFKMATMQLSWISKIGTFLAIFYQ